MHVQAAHSLITRWYAEHARDLPWRDAACSPWGVLVSEVMLQQTPVSRVLPRWEEWMRRWPEPSDAAAASGAEILQVWDRLGYPRRALRLQAAAAAITTEHGGTVPESREELRALPGVGEYTAAAVACFAFGHPEVVVDTNIRRVHARLFSWQALPGPTYTAAQRALAHRVFPDPQVGDGELSCAWNIAVMELGALVCTARSPQCGECPVRAECAWLVAGAPEATAEQRTRGQAWAGTDRQVRGALMALLRAQAPRDETELMAAVALPSASAQQRQRCLDSLVADGLAVRTDQGVSLPGVR